MKMRAVFNCSADEPGEISFKEGDVLINVEESGEDGWYIGTIENTSERGLFPYNYVERISETTSNNNKKEPHLTQSTSTVEPKSTSLKEKTSLPGFPALDAFELAMASGKSFKSASSTPNTVKPKLEIKRTASPIIISEKPALLSPTRARSYSASTALTSHPNALKPSQIVGNTKSALELALSKGPPPPPSSLRSSSFSTSTKTNGLPAISLFKSPELTPHDVEDEDGYQMVKPSQLRQRQQQMKPIASTSSKPVAWKKPAAPSPKVSKLDLPCSNPMPRLPSRPVSTASRRSRQSTQRSIVKEEKTPPPILKPKPILPSQPSLPPRPTKSRSTSNPPPIQPKPAMSSIEILMSKNAEKNKLESSTRTKPVYGPKPNTSRPSFDSWRSEEMDNDKNVKPSSLRARSATNPISMDWTKPKTIMETKPIKKGPPPPPSRNRNKSLDRYEILFDTIQDDGYVDGETTRFIWLKSKLSNEELGRLWKECDPDHKGLLDKDGFIDGMKKIDAILMNKI